MKAIFSFFDTTGEPLKSSQHWLNPKFFLYTWVLTVHQASKYFDEVELVTDSKCKKLFEQLNLPFSNIRTDLDEVLVYPKELWALGKIKAYQIQDKPFIHIDNDVILFDRLPDRLLNAPIGFQNIEADEWFDHSYKGQVDNLTYSGENLPKSWGCSKHAVNCGIYICNDLNYNREYCNQAFELVDNNLPLIMNTGHAGLYCVIFEQYMASNVSHYMGIKEELLSENHRNEEYDKYKYVHIWGEKRNLQWFEMIETIIKRDYPNYYNLIETLVK